MFNQKRDYKDLDSRISLLARYILNIERRLDGLTEQFNNRPEPKQLAELKDALFQLQRQLDECSAQPQASVEVFNGPVEASICTEESQQQKNFDAP